ncbi:HNH endonuclease [Paenibacillus agricola]|uniref:HNH endonuclease n=1 Tax=Paenibacillus agricola TaxID=2716264 RepID=A0ABX0JH98_9BACL|nr:hypothetical protein [Paenibacillus agricola]NHN34621.1 hypothetical protein [Paenibacillus agricola]
MRNLLPITVMSPEDIFLAIAKSKNSPCKDLLYVHNSNLNPMSCIQSSVLERYEEYQDKRNNLFDIDDSKFIGTEKDCLKNCYDSSTTSFEWMYAELFKIQDTYNKDKCPYCGINSPSTRDHYLPKELYPEFAVMSHNLVPCCDDCNRLKGKKFKDNLTKKRMFIHFYYDEIPNDVFIEAFISIGNKDEPVVNVVINPPVAYTNAFYDIVQSHYKELNVLERIENEVNTYVNEIYQINKKCLEEGLEEVDLKRLSLIDIRIYERNHGINYWKAVISRGILQCADFYKL